MSIFQLVHDDLGIGRDLVVENQVSAARQKQIAVGMDSAPETKFGPAK